MDLDRVIEQLSPKLLLRLQGENQIKLGALTPTRDFNFVADTCKAFLAVARSKNTVGKLLIQQ